MKIMYKVLRLASEVLFKNKFLSFLLALEFAFLSFYTLDNLQNIDYLLYPQKVMSGCNSGNFVYFSPIKYDLYSLVNNVLMENEEDPYACFDELQGFSGAENVYEFYSQTGLIKLNLYPKQLSEKLNISMRRGKWLCENDALTNSGNIACVTSNSNRKIGDLISFTDENGNVDTVFEVIGIASDPYFEFNQYVSGEELGLSAIAEKTEKTELLFGNEIIWADDTTLFDKVKNEVRPEATSRLLFFDSVSEETMNYNLEILKRSGSVLNENTSFDNVRIENFIKEDLPQIASAWCVITVGFCSSLAVFFYRCKYTFYVFTVCGADEKLKTLSFSAAAVIIILISVLPVAALLPIICAFNIFSWTFSFVKTGYKALLLLSIIFIIVSVSVTVILFGKNRRRENDCIK